MSQILSIHLLAWRCEIAVAGIYLQEFYRLFDRKQWDRAERMSRGACEFLARNHPALRCTLSSRVAEYRARCIQDDFGVEQEAWQRAVRSLMCLVSLFGMVGDDGKKVKGLQGWRSEATKSLAVAIQASKTAFPREDLERLVDNAVTQALDSAVGVLEEDLRESGAACERESRAVAVEVRKACEVALRSFIEAQLSV